MTAPRFRSTAGISARPRLATPAIDRATFVLFGVGTERYAVAVERVERVLRRTAARETADRSPVESIMYSGQTVRLVHLHSVLGGEQDNAAQHAAHDASDDAPNAGPADASDRILIFLVEDCWVAAAVDAVFEVATIDAAIVEPISAERAVGDAGETRHCPPGARGYFQRQGHTVVVLDVTRVMRMVYASAAYATSNATSNAVSTASAAVDSARRDA